MSNLAVVYIVAKNMCVSSIRMSSSPEVLDLDMVVAVAKRPTMIISERALRLLPIF